jgi:hypothetical protein
MQGLVRAARRNQNGPRINGANALSAPLGVTTEAAGGNCVIDGIQASARRDGNGNGALDGLSSSVPQRRSNYVC